MTKMTVHGVDLESSRASTGLPAKLPPAACHNNCPPVAMLSKLLAATLVVGTTLADEPVGTVIGIDLGTTYSVRQLSSCACCPQVAPVCNCGAQYVPAATVRGGVRQRSRRDHRQRPGQPHHPVRRRLQRWRALDWRGREEPGRAQPDKHRLRRQATHRPQVRQPCAARACGRSAE